MAAAALDPELFLPEPDPRDVKYTIVSVDDHVVEPPHVFERYLPKNLRERGPQMIETPEGHQVWQFEGEFHTQVGMNAVAGRRPETVELEPPQSPHRRPRDWRGRSRVFGSQARSRPEGGSSGRRASRP